MKNHWGKIVVGVALFMTAIVPMISYAQTAPSLFPTGYWGGPNGLLSCTGDYAGLQGTTTAPPCTSLCDLIQTLINILYFAMSIAVFIISPILIAAGGIMIMMAGASPEMLGSGKKILTGTLVGIAIIVCSYLIINTFVNIVFPNTLFLSRLGGFGNAQCQPPSTQ